MKEKENKIATVSEFKINNLYSFGYMRSKHSSEYNSFILNYEKKNCLNYRTVIFLMKKKTMKRLRKNKLLKKEKEKQLKDFNLKIIPFYVVQELT